MGVHSLAKKRSVNMKCVRGALLLAALAVFCCHAAPQKPQNNKKQSAQDLLNKPIHLFTRDDLKYLDDVKAIRIFAGCLQNFQVDPRYGRGCKNRASRRIYRELQKMMREKDIKRNSKEFSNSISLFNEALSIIQRKDRTSHKIIFTTFASLLQ